jgi:hypothetical protein
MLKTLTVLSGALIALVAAGLSQENPPAYPAPMPSRRGRQALRYVLHHVPLDERCYESGTRGEASRLSGGRPCQIGQGSSENVSGWHWHG